MERLRQWLCQQLPATHCHRDEDELREHLVSFQARRNDELSAVHRAYVPKLTWIHKNRNFGLDGVAV